MGAFCDATDGGNNHICIWLLATKACAVVTNTDMTWQDSHQLVSILLGQFLAWNQHNGARVRLWPCVKQKSYQLGNNDAFSGTGRKH